MNRWISCYDIVVVDIDGKHQEFNVPSDWYVCPNCGILEKVRKNNSKPIWKFCPNCGIQVITEDLDNQE